MPMFPRVPLLLVPAAVLAGAAFPASAGEITGERIFDRGSPRVDKVDKALAAAEAAADAELKQAQLRRLQAQVRNWSRAAEALAAEEASAMRAGDSAGVAAVALRRKSVASRLESLKAKLAEETGVPEAPPQASAKPVPAKPEPALPPKGAAPAPAPDPVPAAEAAPASAVAVALVPAAMLGRWKITEGGRPAGFIEVSSTGQNKSYALFKPWGDRDVAGGGLWKVDPAGEVILIGDANGGAESLRVFMTAEGKAAGFRWSRKSDGVPYRRGNAVELTKEGR